MFINLEIACLSEYLGTFLKILNSVKFKLL